MLFSSITFLYFFLPLVIAANFLLPARLSNPFLLLASLVFYAWGEGIYVLLMLFAILNSYAVGLALVRRRNRTTLLLGVGLNLLPLFYFKYSGFLLENLPFIGQLFSSVGDGSSIHLPIGISFFTFQAISYLIDVYRGVSPAQKNPLNVGLYIALFPQLIAGPIVRYEDFAPQIRQRDHSFDRFSEGATRFIIGLGKKVLIANTMGECADAIMALPYDVLPAYLAWLGILAYTLQIYFDFSGYSDMAIGLGLMFGFRFPENFNRPYISRSIQEFWRRWHISLSRWFRDYMYIPMGGNRGSALRTYFNLIAVFILCGAWHGASWNFIIWGAIHGVFLILERTAVGRLIDKAPAIISHFYVLTVVVFAWVFFRIETLPEAMQYLEAMFAFERAFYFNVSVASALSNEFVFMFIVGWIVAFDLHKKLLALIAGKTRAWSTLVTSGGAIAVNVFYVCVFVYASASLAAGSHNPFLYFRF